ncbi:DUF2786 domain-containing protein [Streptomyces sp. HC44]|uniref:DUF2786 domain-containing protein n=1 Tax=Streptomyces scabichelini TaxID=2711217 RepID=A0A6G4VFU9_9ACTN|nr:DUF2786 domain-containing protein [Streptomyces scabichelini]
MSTSTPGPVDRAFETALYTDTDTALDTAASLLATAPAADAELTRRGEEFIATAWRRGWQPADVVRIVRRELADTHVRLVSRLILSAEARHKQPRGPRWTAQLQELNANTVRTERTDRFAHATAVLELYRLLLRLPPLELLDDPLTRPSQKTAGGRQAPESRMLPRIRALLAKAEATGFPQEAEALTGKAQELMARHSIDEALLAARTPAADAPGACRIGIDPPYETAKATLLDAVATANRCRAVWNEPLGFSTVVGFEPDLEAVELLHTSLLVQATAAMTKAEAAARASGRRRTKSFRQSFLAAYAHSIATRLTSAAETQVTADLLPVLATREAAVSDRADRMFPETTTTRLRGVNDAAGWTQGAEAADRAQVEPRRQLP